MSSEQIDEIQETLKQVLENQEKILKYIEEQKAEKAATLEIHNRMMSNLGS